MNRYQSHKVVEAFKIDGIESTERTADGEFTTYLFANREHQEVTVDRAYMDKHQPQVGGYYVRYADGYESWSPAEAFEEGYTKIE